MTFLDLWGDALDLELGTADRASLFTTDRRKLAVNKAQREFARLTSCYVKQVTIPLTTAREYDIEVAAPDFMKFAPRGVELQQTTIATGDVVTQAGDDFPRRDIPWLNFYRPGWRGTDGTPTCWYEDTNAGAHVIGLDVTPGIPATETWALLVAYVATPVDMVNDTDVPWADSGEALTSLTAWHQALVHFAASNLERLRKDYQASDYQLNRFAAYVSDYLQARMPPARTIGVARDYLREASRWGMGTLVQGDPRR